MKKHLLIAGLVLTIATSVISGTMAAYNTSVDFESNEIVAKQFVMNVEKKEGFATETTKLAPGESNSVNFTVSNFDSAYLTETGMKVFVKIETNLQNTNSKNPLIYNLYKGNVLIASTATEFTEAMGTTVEDGVFVHEVDFSANTKRTDTYRLEAEWLVGDWNNKDIEYQNKNFGTAKITVSGFQADSNGDFVAAP